jgi:hypothetical protein
MLSRHHSDATSTANQTETQMITNKEILIEVNLARPVKTLRALASAAGIVGRSKMNKAELVEAIAAFEVAQERGAVVKSISTTGRVAAVAIPGDWRMQTVKLGDEIKAPTPFGPVGVVVTEENKIALGFEHVPADLCGHGIKRGRKCSICTEDAAKAPKVGQRYRRADGDVVELKAVFPLDESIAFLVVQSPEHTYREGLRGTVSFSGLAENYKRVLHTCDPDACCGKHTITS